MVCEEMRIPIRAHTQIWKYAQNLSAAGLLSTQLSSTGFRGKTTLLGLSAAPAADIRKWMESSLSGN